MKQHIVGIVIGILCTLVVGLGYLLFSLGKTVTQDHQALSQIVALINNANKAATSSVTAK